MQGCEVRFNSIISIQPFANNLWMKWNKLVLQNVTTCNKFVTPQDRACKMACKLMHFALHLERFKQGELILCRVIADLGPVCNKLVTGCYILQKQFISIHQKVISKELNWNDRIETNFTTPINCEKIR